MIKILLFIFVNFFFFNGVLAKDININEDINLEFKCSLEKKIIKNSEYNYQTFLAKDLKEKDLDKFKIESKKPQTLFITGLTLFLSESASLNVKVVNKDVVLFKSIDKEKNYSESGIITRKTGELIHEITKNIKSENSEKYISIYSCTETSKKSCKKLRYLNFSIYFINLIFYAYHQMTICLIIFIRRINLIFY